MKRKRKVYFQNSPLWQLICLFFFVCVIMCFYYAIFFFTKAVMTHFSTLSDPSDVALFIFLELVFLICPVLLMKELIAAEGFNIHLNDKEVWMNQEKTDKNHRVQYEANVKLCDIQDMKLIKTNHNSKGKGIIGYPQCFAMKKYLVFIKQDKKEVWMNVTHFTNYYLIGIMGEIVHRISLSGHDYTGTDPFSVIERYSKEEKGKGLNSLD